MRKNSKLTFEWSDFNHEEGYEKETQDVVLKNGDQLFMCWPNAGFWCVLDKKLNPKYYGDDNISVADTAKVRKSHFDKLNPPPTN